MGKKWQELEFLDYKERQIRRRAQKKRRLFEGGGTGAGDEDGAESRTQVKILVFGLLSIVCVTVYFLYLRSGLAGPVGRGLKVTRLKGEVLLSSVLKDWPAAKGASVPENVRVVTGVNGACELNAFAPDTTIILFENSEILFRGLRVGSATNRRGIPDFQVDIDVVRGNVVFEFKNEGGAGILHARTPQGVELWGKLVYIKVACNDDSSRIIVADGLLKAESDGDKVIIPGDRQMISTESEPLSTPKALNVIREVWNW